MIENTPGFETSSVGSRIAIVAMGVPLLKIKTVAALSALAAGAPIEAQERPSVAPKNMQAIAPALADYADNVLFGDVWV